MTLLNWPAGRVPANLSWEFMRPDISVGGPSGVTQHQGRTGAKWAFQAQLPPVIDSSVSAAVKTVLQRCTAASVWMQAPDHSYRRQSTRYGVPAVKGASQTGASIALDGFVPSITDAVKAGDRIGFTTGQVVTVTADADSNTAGEVTASIDPPLRSSPADNSLVYIDQPLAIFKLPPRAGWGVTAPYQHGFTIEGLEDIASGAPDADYPAWLAEQTTNETVGYVDIVRDGVLHAGMTVTRASTGYYVNKAGVLTAASTNIPRTEYDALGAVLGLLVEGARTNLWLRSEEFDNASWTKTDNTVTANSIAAPDGATTADLLTEGVAGTALVSQGATISANATATVSTRIKAGTVTWVRLAIQETAATTNRVSGWFNLSTGAVGSVANGGTASGAVARIRTLPGGYYLISLTGAVNNSATAVTGVLSSASADASDTRVNGATYYLWGAQFEQATFPSSYIPTTTATASRAADTISTTSLTSLLGFNASEGAIYAEVGFAYVEASASALRAVVAVDDGTSSERTTMQVSASASDLDSVIRDGGSQVANLDGKALSSGVFQKVAVAWATNDAELVTDGVQQSTDTALTTPTPTQFLVGQHGSGGHGFCHIKNLRYYARRLSSTELVRLTT